MGQVEQSGLQVGYFLDSLAFGDIPNEAVPAGDLASIVTALEPVRP